MELPAFPPHGGWTVVLPSTSLQQGEGLCWKGTPTQLSPLWTGGHGWQTLSLAPSLDSCALLRWMGAPFHRVGVPVIALVFQLLAQAQALQVCCLPSQARIPWSSCRGCPGKQQVTAGRCFCYHCPPGLY